MRRSAPDASEDRCRATHGAGLLAAVQGDMRSGQRRMAEAVELYRAVGDRAGSVRPQSDLASTMTFLGDTRSGEEFATQALHTARGESDPWALAYAIHTVDQLRLAQARYPESADALVLSVRTVERHITNIYNKTGATSRRQAEAFARAHGAYRTT